MTSKRLDSWLSGVVVLFALTLAALHVSAHNDGDMMSMENMHRSTVAKVANELNKVADRVGGIGQELREVAKEQNDMKEKVAEAIEEVENRSWLKTFFIGTDYKNLGDLRSSLVTTDNHIARLERAKERTGSAIDADIDEQIAALKNEKAVIESFIKEHEDRFSLFGWFVRLFTE